MSAIFGSLDSRKEAFEARTLDIDSLVPIARLGWVAKGVVYALIGVLTVPIALGGGGGEEASQTGAIQQVAEAPFGTALLWLMAIGLLLYALWRLTTSLLPGDNDLDTWAHRIAYFSSAVIYGYLAWTAISFATGSGSSSGGGSGGGDSAEKLSKTILEMPGGQWLLGLAGLGTLAVAGYFAYKGYANRFMAELDLSGASANERELIDKGGTIGWIGRALTTAFIGVFIVQAAITADPDEAKGFDQSLREVADNWWGSALVLIAGICLVAYGVFVIVSARRRRLVGP